MKSSFLTPSRQIVIVLVLFFGSVILVLQNSHPLMGCKTEEKPPESKPVSWKFPDVASIKDDTEGKMIRLGRSIFIETYKHIGPDVPDSSRRYLKTNMDCQNCHFDGGTRQNVFGLVGVYSKYPEFDSRTAKDISIEQRINECMTRSMNGKALPVDGNEMKALAAYLKWLSTDIPKGATVKGQGVPDIPLLNRAADTAKGRQVYQDHCVSCHGFDGSGTLVKPANADVSADSLRGYDTPPVYGVFSYNDGAGMYRELVATAFIHAKMPLQSANLTIEQSYDVAAYINSQPRPNKANLDKDFPDLKLKPVDAPYPPFADNFSASQHKYGPYLEMLKMGEKGSLVNPNAPVVK